MVNPRFLFRFSGKYIIVCILKDEMPFKMDKPGRVAQSVTCLATDASLTADPGVASSIPARSHTFVEIDQRSFSSLPLNHSRRVVVSYKRKYVHEVLVNCLFKLAQEKSVVR